MAIDYALEGIRVNVVVPGFTLTPIVRELVADPKVLEWNVQNIPLKRGAEPEEIAGADRLPRFGRRLLHDRIVHVRRRRPHRRLTRLRGKSLPAAANQLTSRQESTSGGNHC